MFETYFQLILNGLYIASMTHITETKFPKSETVIPKGILIFYSQFYSIFEMQVAIL